MKKAFLLFALMFCMGISSFVSAATINVPGDQPTLTAAIAAASPGDTILLACGLTDVQLGTVIVNKTLTIQGASPCMPTKPTIQFTNVNHYMSIEADNVTIDGVRFHKTVSGSGVPDNLMIAMFSSSDGITVPSVVPYGNLLVQNSVFQDGRRAIRINTKNSATIINNQFNNQIRDNIFVSNVFGGTMLISGNTVTGGAGGAVVRFEAGPVTDQLYGTMIVDDNILDGLTVKPNFMVFNHWLYPMLTVTLSTSGNNISNLTSNAIVLFAPSNFAKLTSPINFNDNDIFDAGRGIMVDYSGGGSGVAANGQINVQNNVLCRFASADLDLFIPILNSGIGTNNKAIGARGPLPMGATTAMFGPGDAANVASINYGCQGRPPELVVSPTSLDFGSQQVGTTSASQIVTLTNVGGGTLNISSITNTGNFSFINGCGATLAPSESCPLTVVFSPTALGVENGNISIVSDSSTGSPTLVPLTGIGTNVNTPFLDVSKLALSFSFPNQILGTDSPPQTTTLTNVGTATLILYDITISGPFILTNGCPGSLEPGASCPLTVVFVPVTEGLSTGEIHILSNSGESNSGNMSRTSHDAVGTVLTVVELSGTTTNSTLTGTGCSLTDPTDSTNIKNLSVWFGFVCLMLGYFKFRFIKKELSKK